MVLGLRVGSFTILQPPITTYHLPSITMGKGDKRSKKGKIFRGSFGKRRPGKRRAAAAKKTAQRAAAAKKR
jgi:30S ribosomal protein S31